MSAREFKPGDVVLVDGERALVQEMSSGDLYVEYADYARLGGRSIDSLVGCDIRPLVVIDPKAVVGHVGAPSSAEGARYIARLLREADENNGIPTFGRLADAFDPKPRIEEPTGLGAVVEDDESRIWIRTDGKPGYEWYLPNQCIRPWSYFNAVRVLSEGVTS